MRTLDGATSASSISAASVSITGPAPEQATRDTVELRGSCTTGLAVQVSGDVAQAVSFNCVAGSFRGQVQLSDGEGLKTVRVSQTGSNGVESSATRLFVRDNTGPAVTVITPAAGLAVRGTSVIQGNCETGLEVVIRENGAVYRVPCTAGMFATTLTLTSADGAVALMIGQEDAAGNKTDLVVQISKDTVAPSVNITHPTTGATVSSQSTIQGACETGLQVTVAGAGVAAPAVGPCNNGAYSIAAVFTAGAGSKAVQVSQTDAAGNSANFTRSFTREADSAPAIAITQPAASTLFQNTLSVSGTCQNGLTVNFSGAGWMSPASTSCANGTFSATITFTAGDGTKNLIASQTSNGLTGSASRSFVRDTTAPVVTIAAPAANSWLRTSAALSGACENGLPVQIAGAGANASSTATCSNGAFSANVTLSNGDGAKVITVSQTDAAGNTGSVSRTFNKDSVAPVITITSPATDTQAETGLTVVGTCEGTFQVVASGSGLSQNAATACANNSFSLPVLFSNGDGAKTVQVSQTDAAGNTGVSVRNFVRYTPAPVLDGVQLYAQHCAGCHGALASSAKQNRTAGQISTAIGLVPTMNALSFLTPAQREAIAQALVVQASAPAFACDQNMSLESRSIAKNMKRHTRRQYINTLTSLVGRAFSASAAQNLVNEAMNGVSLPADDDTSFSRFDSSVVQQHMKAYFDVADRLAGLVTGSANYSAFVTAFVNLDRGACTSVNPSALTSDCAARFIANFGRRALRRPLTSDEPSLYMSAYTGAGGNAAGINAVVFRLLMAPAFLYQIENDGTQVSGQLYRLASHAVASRLSYMFWNTMPDETLFQQAASANLADDAAFATALNYVADHANAQDSIREFMNEWLKLRHIPQFATNNPSLNYLANGLTLDSSLRSAMIEEIQELGTYVFRNNLTFTDLFTTDVSFARDSRLMSIYGVTTAAAATVTPQNAVRMPAGQRVGLLTRGALLLGGTELANPIKRGIRVRKEILCLPLDNPPADLPSALEPPAPNVNMTTRERYDNATSAPACMNCHQLINTLGHALGNYNSFGKYGTTEPTFDSNGAYSGRNLSINAMVDLATSVGPGLTAANAAEYSSLIANHRNTRQCISEKALRFVEGRMNDRTKEGCRLNRMYDLLAQSRSLKDFLKSIAQDQEFRHRLMGP